MPGIGAAADEVEAGSDASAAGAAPSVSGPWWWRCAIALALAWPPAVWQSPANRARAEHKKFVPSTGAAASALTATAAYDSPTKYRRRTMPSAGAVPHLAFVVVAAAAAAAYKACLGYLVSVTEEKMQEFTSAQHGIALAYGLLLAVWLGAEAGFFVLRRQPRYDSLGTRTPEEDDEENLVSKPEAPAAAAAAVGAGPKLLGLSAASLPALRAAGEFVGYMGYLYVCDRTTLIAKGPKHVSSPHFWGVNLLLLVIGLLTLRDSGEAAAAKPLQRDQTEEWKGWMQIMFILYHYFAVRRRRASLSRDPTRRTAPHS